MQIKTKKQANQIVGNIGKKNNKMPCMSYGLSVKNCNPACKIPCYAKKAFYRMPSVSKAHANREASLSNPQWVGAMVFLLKGQEFFRWHDSGDIQNLAHLDKILHVVRLTPNCRHWLPTKAIKIIKQRSATIGSLENLIVRISSFKVNAKPLLVFALNGRFKTARTINKDCFDKEIGFTCPADKQDGQCLDCRACWDKKELCINYNLI